jgi:hypothetical protein
MIQQSDLFTSHLPKREQLLLFLRSQEFTKTSDVIRWGSMNFSNRAERDARQLAEEGLIRRLTDEEKRFRGFNGKEDVWTTVVFR